MTNANELTLYFSPLACSFASRAVLYDVEADVRFVEVVDKKTADGKDFHTINPLGLVPALVLDDGEVLTENAAVLQYLGERYAERGLIPKDARERTRMQSWLSFIGTELHKAVFAPLLSPAGSPPEVRAWALSKADERLSIAAAKLANRASLLASGPSVADAYMTAVLNWVIATPIDLKRWPTLVKYRATMLERPSFARAFAEERSLWAGRHPAQAKALGIQ